jgi:peroxiredoxin
MFKNLSFLLIAVIILVSCTTKVKNEFVITGTVDTVLSAKIYLQKRTDGPLITIDSSMISSAGEFKIKGAIDYPEVYYLTIPATKSSVPFFIEPAQIIVNIRTKNIDKTKITGSKTQAAYDSYLDKLDEFNAKIRQNYTLHNSAEEAGDQAKIRYYDSVLTAFDDQRGQYSKDYVLQNPASFISPYIMFRNSYTYGMEDLEKALNTFDTSLSHSVYTGFMSDYLKVLKRVAVGQNYVPFSLPDSAGVNVPVSDFAGKGYLLMDFWASWCAPCRAENPNVVALYKKYHPRGFDIFGVSFDSNRDRWLKAIADDSLTWHHVSDLKGWENAAGKIYGIRSIPSNVLLDSNGVIIAKNILGEELKAKLEELYPEPVKATKLAKKK